MEAMEVAGVAVAIVVGLALLPIVHLALAVVVVVAVDAMTEMLAMMREMSGRR